MSLLGTFTWTCYRLESFDAIFRLQSFGIVRLETPGRFAAVGCVATVAFFILFNVAMVLGLVPVVGVPLPLVSYGGTVMFTTMACFGILLSVHLGRDDRLSAQGVI